MISLNKFNGELRIGSLFFNCDLTSTKFEMQKGQTIVINGVKNGEWNSFILPDVGFGEYAMYVQFFNNKLVSVNIGLGKKYAFPPFEITKDEKELLKKKLDEIGGEETFTWGKVFYFEDFKGGSVSIGVKYNQM